MQVVGLGLEEAGLGFFVFGGVGLAVLKFLLHELEGGFSCFGCHAAGFELPLSGDVVVVGLLYFFVEGFPSVLER